MPATKPKTTKQPELIRVLERNLQRVTEPELKAKLTTALENLKRRYKTKG